MRERILSIDASLSSTGYAILDRETKDVIEVGKINTTNKDSEDFRIFKIADELIECIKTYGIKEAVMENQFLGRNAKTALQLSRLRGAITFGLNCMAVNVEYLQPAEIRKIFVGCGNASKEEIAEAIQEKYVNNRLVKALGTFSDKNNKNKNSDMYDAISIGVAYIELCDSVGDI